MSKYCNSCRWWMVEEIRDRDPELEGETMCRYKHPSELPRDHYGVQWTQVHGWGSCRHHSRAWFAMALLPWLNRWDSLCGRWDAFWWRWVRGPWLDRKRKVSKTDKCDV